MLSYEAPGDFSKLEDDYDDNFNPDTGEIMLGDIVISVDKVLEQAESYGHTPRREYAFLIAHSMLHLFGYDHMTPEEAVPDGSKAASDPRRNEYYKVRKNMNTTRTGHQFFSPGFDPCSRIDHQPYHWSDLQNPTDCHYRKQRKRLLRMCL